MIFGKRQHTRGLPSPLVEAVTKHKGVWTVEDTPVAMGMTNNVDHTMLVPLSDDECLDCGKYHNDAIRAHELLHSKLSPLTPEAIKVRVGTEVIAVSEKNTVAAEEYRVNHSLMQIEGIDKLQSIFCEKVAGPGIAAMMDSGRYQEIIRLTVGAGPTFDDVVYRALDDYKESIDRLQFKDDGKRPKYTERLEQKLTVAYELQDALYGYTTAAARIMGVPPEKSFKEFLNDEYGCSCSNCRDEAESAYEREYSSVNNDSRSLPSWARTEELAAFLEVYLKDMQKALNDMLKGSGPIKDDLDSILSREDDKGLRPGDAPSRDPSDDELEIKLTGGGGASGPVRWGIPDKITEANMPQSIPLWKIQRSNRAVDEGTIPRYMHRWPVDKRVFSRTKRLPGGTILIDDSASMGIGSEELDRMIEVAPAATIAVYAGEDGGDGGEIRVVARDGKRAKTQDLEIEDHGGNAIDGPALDWLGDQPQPRIWITDGGVTALSGHTYQQLGQVAMGLCRQHSVNVVRDAEGAAEMLKSGETYR